MLRDYILANSTLSDDLVYRFFSIYQSAENEQAWSNGCPGPALIALGMGSAEAILFVIAMFAGMIAAQLTVLIKINKTPIIAKA